MVNGLLNADWDAVFEAAGNIGKATANIAGGLTDIANAATTVAESPLGKVLGFVIEAPIKGIGEAAEIVNNATTWFKESFDPGLEGEQAFTGYIKQSVHYSKPYSFTLGSG